MSGTVLRPRLGRVPRRIALALLGVVAVLLAPFAVIFAGALASQNCLSLVDSGTRYDVIFVLGGGMEYDGRLHPSSQERVGAAAALYRGGVAPRVHITGGGWTDDGPKSALQMALLAQDLGVPAAAITTEVHARSTLQNALFSQPFLAAEDRLVLVSTSLHLSRGWLSLVWAGHPPSGICHSSLRETKFHDYGPPFAVREYLAFWFNLARATGYSLARALGADPARLERFLD